MCRMTRRSIAFAIVGFAASLTLVSPAAQGAPARPGA